MADDDVWYRWRQREDDSSLEERSRGQPRGRLSWRDRNTRPELDDDQMSAEETNDSLTESQEETSRQVLCGNGWKKLAIGSLAIAAVCAIIAVILYREDCTSELCHKYWAPYKGNCYYFSKTILGWEESRQNCISQGSELLVIRSKEEQEFVAQFNLSRAYWIGIKHNPLESAWMWVDGTPGQDDLM
ncbi:C-type lectin domain family 4 member E-like isoform X1 [Cetorhinus maximus]